jgi:tetratricopeptide (TPR) repeat protein
MHLYPTPLAHAAAIARCKRAPVLAWYAACLAAVLLAAPAWAQPNSADVLAQQAQAEEQAGRDSQAEALWTEAVEAAQTVGDNKRAARLAHSLLACRLRLEDYDGAAAAAQVAAAAYENLGDGAQAGQTYMFLGSMLRAAEEYERAGDAYADALAIYHNHHDAAGEAAAHLSLGIVADLQGLLPKAASEFTNARELYRALSDRLNVALCYRNQGYALERLGLTDEALAAYEQAQFLYAEAGALEDQARMLLTRGRVQLARCEYRAAQARCQGALELLGPKGHDSLRAAALVGSGKALAGLDDDAGARKQLEEAWGIYTALKDDAVLAELAPVLAKVAEALGDKAAAKHYREWQPAAD